MRLTFAEIHPPPSYPHYLWYPKVLANASNSAEHLARRLISYITSPEIATPSEKEIEHYIRKELIQNGLGIVDSTNSEIELIVNSPVLSSVYFADMISRRAQIGWSTHGHSAVDVNVYGSKGSDTLRGNHENTEVGKFLREYLDVDVDAITSELKRSQSFGFTTESRLGWTGRIPTEQEIEAASWHYES